MSERVRIVEVGPRDGLQNEPVALPPPVRVAFVGHLAAAGLTEIEVASLVSPQRVPQMADAEAVLEGTRTLAGVRRLVLVPNRRGWERLSADARRFGVATVALFTAASQTFSQKNVGRSIEETLDEYDALIPEIRRAGLWVRVYISTATHCPYEGKIAPVQVVPIAVRLRAAGAEEIALSDTLGHAIPDDIRALIDATRPAVPVDALACHLHDTRGRALECVEAALGEGIRTFDGSASGLGGCPFAPGAAGNLATEALAERLETLGFTTGVDAAAVRAAGQWLRDETLRRSQPL